MQLIAAERGREFSTSNINLRRRSSLTYINTGNNE